MKLVVRGGIICSCALACIVSAAMVVEGMQCIPDIQKSPVVFRLNGSPVPTYLYSTLLILIGVFVFVAGSIVFNRVTSGQYFHITLRGLLTLIVFVACGCATLNMYHEWLGRQLVRAFFDQAEPEAVEDVSQP